MIFPTLTDEVRTTQGPAFETPDYLFELIVAEECQHCCLSNGGGPTPKIVNAGRG